MNSVLGPLLQQAVRKAGPSTSSRSSPRCCRWATRATTATRRQPDVAARAAARADHRRRLRTTSPRRCASPGPTSTSSSPRDARLQAVHDGGPRHSRLVRRHDDGAQRHRLRHPRFGTGDEWFTGPANTPEGLFLGSYGPEDANQTSATRPSPRPPASAASRWRPARHRRFVGGDVPFALRATQTMYDITVGEHTAYQVPILEFRGTPTGIDVTAVARTGILPQINTGMAGRVAAPDRSVPGWSRPRSSASPGRCVSWRRAPPREAQRLTAAAAGATPSPRCGGSALHAGQPVPAPAQRSEMISAAMLTAVSSAVRAPRSSRSGSTAGRAPPRSAPPRAAVPGGPRGCAATPWPRCSRPWAGAARPRAGAVELRVVGEHGQHGPLVDAAGLRLRREVAVRPADDHLVRGGKRLSVAKTGRRRRPSPGSRGSAPSRPWPRRSRWRRRRSAAAVGRTPPRRPACPRRGARRRAVDEHRAVAALEQAPHVVGDGVVAALAAEPALVGLARAARPHDDAPTHRSGSGCSTTVATATGRPASMSSATAPSSGKLWGPTASTKTSRMPPQVSPTATASSSLTP